jgi:tRNA(Ile)-lysidine synthase
LGKNSIAKAIDTVTKLQKSSRILKTHFEERTDNTVRQDRNAFIFDEKFKKLSECEQRFLLGYWIPLITRGGNRHVDIVYERYRSGWQGRVELPKHYLCEIYREKIILYPRSDISFFMCEKEPGTSELTLWELNKRLILSEELTNKSVSVRNRRDGDKFMGKKLKKLLSDKKLSLYERDRAILVEENGKIAWVEHISHNGCETLPID